MEYIRDLELLEEIEEIENLLTPQTRIPRVNFVDRQNAFEYFSNQGFFENFGFTKEQFPIVLDKFRDKFSSSLPEYSPEYQFIVFLDYVKSNQFMRKISTQSYIQLPLSKVNEIVNSVANDISFYSRTYIVYPTVEEQNICAARILENYGFPGCSKIQDGCQIKTT